MAPRKIIIDTDPGVDDTLAMLLAFSALPAELEVLLISVTYGNVDLQNCLRNVVTLFHHIEMEIAWRKDQGRAVGFEALRRSPPLVAVGPEHPLADEMLMADYFHGRDGLGGIHSSHPDMTPSDTWRQLFDSAKNTSDPIAEELQKSDNLFTASRKPAHQEILRLLRENEPQTITIVAIGPLTNLALAAAEDPETFLRAKEVVVMGGNIDVPGNITPVAEFNTYADTTAAARLYALTSPSPSTTMPPTPPPSDPSQPQNENPPPYLSPYPPPLSRRLNLTLFPLDTTSNHTLTRTDFLALVSPLVKAGSPLATWTKVFMTATFEKIASLHPEQPGKEGEAPANAEPEVALQLHDPLCVWYCISSLSRSGPASDVSGWEFKKDVDLRVETAGQWTRGMCVVDRRGRRKEQNEDDDDDAEDAVTADAESAHGRGGSGNSADRKREKVPGDKDNWLGAQAGNRLGVCVRSGAEEGFGRTLMGRVFAIDVDGVD